MVQWDFELLAVNPQGRKKNLKSFVLWPLIEYPNPINLLRDLQLILNKKRFILFLNFYSLIQMNSCIISLKLSATIDELNIIHFCIYIITQHKTYHRKKISFHAHQNHKINWFTIFLWCAFHATQAFSYYGNFIPIPKWFAIPWCFSHFRKVKLIKTSHNL